MGGGVDLLLVSYCCAEVIMWWWWMKVTCGKDLLVNTSSYSCSCSPTVSDMPYNCFFQWGRKGIQCNNIWLINLFSKLQEVLSGYGLPAHSLAQFSSGHKLSSDIYYILMKLSVVFHTYKNTGSFTYGVVWLSQAILDTITATGTRNNTTTITTTLTNNNYHHNNTSECTSTCVVRSAMIT